MSKAYDVKTMTIHLQGVGRQNAIFAGNIMVGDILVWNYGTTSEVLSIEDPGKAYIIITERYESWIKKGELLTSERKMKKDRLVAYAKAQSVKSPDQYEAEARDLVNQAIEKYGLSSKTISHPMGGFLLIGDDSSVLNIQAAWSFGSVESCKDSLARAQKLFDTGVYFE